MSQSELCQEMSLRSAHSSNQAVAPKTREGNQMLFNLKEEALLLYNIIHHLISGFESSLQMIARIWDAIKKLIAELDDLIYSDRDEISTAQWSNDGHSAYPMLSDLQNRLKRVKRKLFQELPCAYEVIFPKITE